MEYTLMGGEGLIYAIAMAAIIIILVKIRETN